METQFNVVSAFDGVGGAWEALSRLDVKVLNGYSYEIDNNAKTIVKGRYPGVVHMGDIVLADFRAIQHKVDLLIGGSPCGDFSVAGKMAGITGDDGKLFWEYLRAVKELKPRYFLYENVKPADKTVTALITKELGVDYVEINSDQISAQNRVRLYWTNIPDVKPPSDRGIDLYDVMLPQHPYIKIGIDGAIKRKQNKSSAISGAGKHERSGGATSDMDILVITKEWITDIDEQKAYVASLGISKTSKVKMNDIKLGGNLYGKVRRLSVLEAERLQTYPDNYTDVNEMSNTKRWAKVAKSYTVDAISHILGHLPELRA